jgi:hypothetical protein
VDDDHGTHAGPAGTVVGYHSAQTGFLVAVTSNAAFLGEEGGCKKKNQMADFSR